MISDDLSKLFTTPGTSVTFRQGKVIEWDSATGENTLDVGGAALVNVPSLTSEAATLQPGDVVMLLAAGTTWLVLGKVTTPGDPDTVPTWPSDIEALAPLTDLATVTTGTTVTGVTVEDSVVTGALIRTAPTGQRWEIDSPTMANEIRGYTGDLAEVVPAILQVTSHELALSGPDRGAGAATIELDATPSASKIFATAANGVYVHGDGAAGSSMVWADPDASVLSYAGTHQVYADATGAVMYVADSGIIRLISGAGGIDLTTSAGGTVRVNGTPIGTNPQPVNVTDTTDQTSVTSTSFIAGTTTCGTSFTAPASGKVYVTVSSHAEAQVSGTNVYVGFEMRQGATVGSGTVQRAASTDESVSSGVIVAGATRSRVAGSRRVLVTDLTAGNAYNVRTMHLSNGGGSCAVFYRELLIEPVL